MRAQSSLEYLLLLVAFFASLGVILPVAFQTTQSFFDSSDDLLVKRISNELDEQVNLMRFLGNSSSKTFEFVPIKKIVIYSKGNEVFFSSSNALYAVDLFSPQVVEKQEFSSKFIINIKKENDLLFFSVS